MMAMMKGNDTSAPMNVIQTSADNIEQINFDNELASLRDLVQKETTKDDSNMEREE